MLYALITEERCVCATLAPGEVVDGDAGRRKALLVALAGN